MKPILAYLIETLFCSGLFLLFYRLMLVRRVDFTLARRYLVVAMLLAVVIPALRLPLYPAEPIVHQTVEPITGSVVEPIEGVLPTPSATATPTISWEQVIGALYIVAVLTATLLFGWRLHTIRQLRRACRLTRCTEYTLAESEQIRTPFSFWRTIFLGVGYEATERAQIICHERSHIRRRHTLDRLLIELLRIPFWFNPFLWIAERWLTEVQEWQADQDVLREGFDLTTYQLTIFKQLFGYSPDITCGLSNSFTKKRFLMMTQHRRGRYPLLRISAALPLMAGMIYAFGATAAEQTLESDKHTYLQITANTKIISNGQELTPQQLREKDATEWREAGFEAIEQADQLEVAMEKLEYASQADYDADRAVVKAHRQAALSYLARANALQPNDRRTLKALAGLCFRLRDEEGMTERYNTYSQALQATPAELILQDGRIFFNDREVAKEELREVIRDYRVMLDDPTQAMIRISAESHTTMGEILDCKELIREAGVLRIEYDQRMGIGARLLPAPQPASSDRTQGVVETTTRTVKARNLCRIRLNKNGKLLCGTMGYEELMTRGIEGVCDYVKRFITNPNDVKELAERSEQPFTLPDGREVMLPVSKGMITVEVAREVDATHYLALMQALSQTYSEVRSEVARQLFDRPMAALTDPEREIIHRAIPLRLSEAMVQVR